LAATVRDDTEAGLPEMYPMPHTRGIVTTGDTADPDFERIIVQLQRAVREERR
jgi:hypothetical protein